jgi:peptidoglycan hydrolase CwlO-like protein
MNIDAKLVEMAVAIALGAGAFWRIVEMVLERSKYKKKALKLYTQVNTQIISACIAWSQKLEAQVNNLETIKEEMTNIIQDQAIKIADLEKQIRHLEKEEPKL